MKKISIIALIVTLLALICVYITSASAFGDGLNALGDYFGLSGDSSTDNGVTGTTGETSNVNLDSGFSSILQGVLGGGVNSLTNSQLTDILNNYDVNALLGGDSDIINEVMELIGANQTTAKDQTEESGSGTTEAPPPTQFVTVPQYTNVYVTEAPAATYVYTTSAPARKYGDADGDGKLTSADARLALRASVGLKEKGDVEKDSAGYLACEVDGDGKVTSADARLILRASVGLEDASQFGKR